MRGADLVTRTLRAAGVDTVFSLSGNQIMPVYDAAIDSDVRIVHVRHEAAAVFMADAAAQLTGRVGVALVTAAPGFVNALGALVSARASESPVLLLSGDAAVAQDGRGAFQELDQVAISRPLTKWSARARDATRLGETIAEAIAVATSGRPGPVHVALPFDVLQARVADAGPPVSHDSRPPSAALSAESVDGVRAALAGAKRPLVLVGPRLNATRAPGLAGRLGAALGVPVVAMESPRGVNDPALGNIGAVLRQADLVVSLGKRIDFTLGFGQCAPGARFLVVDSDADARTSAAGNLEGRLDGAIDADPLAFVQALIEAAGHGGAASGSSVRADWRGEVTQAIAQRNFPRLGEATASGRLHPATLCAALQRQIDGARDAILVVDGGEFGQWAQACLSAPRRIINGPAGAIGGGLAAAISARCMSPEATVFAVMGDGTAGFHFSEIDTAVRAGLPVVFVIGNDACWNAEHQIQLRDYGPARLIGCDLAETRYDEAAIGLGGHGAYVTHAGALDEALARAVASGKPAVVNVMIEGLAAPSGAGH